MGTTLPLTGPGADFEVDAANGRIYVDPRFEGHRLTISYNATARGERRSGPEDGSL
jgi:hypothetical protein